MRSSGATGAGGMKILVATDAWHPQVNGVVRTLTHLAEETPALGAKIEFLTPDLFWNLPLPSYPEIRLAVPCGGTVARHVARIAPDAIHVATEGPLGHATPLLPGAAAAIHHQLSYPVS